MSRLLEALHEVFPRSRKIQTPFHLTSDAVCKVLTGAGIAVGMTCLPDFESLDDDNKIGEMVFDGHCGFHHGLVFIHSPACSRHCLEDFECEAGRLHQFISGYQIEMLFDGDVIFFAPESKTITIFHHEGAFAHCRLNSSIEHQT